MIKINIYNPNSNSIKTLDDTGHFSEIESNEASSLNNLVINDTSCQVLSVSMPMKQARQIVKALPFALEEQLANEIEDNFIHYIGKEAGDAYAVVLEKTNIENIINSANPDSLQYLPLLLPITPKGITAFVLDGIANIRISKFSCMSISISILPLVLEKFKSEECELITLCDVNGTNDLLPLELENIGFEVVQSNVSDLIEPINQNLLKLESNLITGPYQKKRAKAETKFSKLKAPIALAAALLVAVFCIQLKEMKQYQQMGDLVSSASKSFYKSLFPDERIRSLRRQFKDKLDEADGGTVTSSGFTSLLGKTSKNIASNGAIEWDAVRFTRKKNELELNLVVSNIAQLDNIKKQLTNDGLQVDITSATETGSKIKGVLKVKQNG